jgi:hypothetical protein
MADNVDGVSLSKIQAMGFGTIVLRTVICLNFVRFALSFLPWFEGTEHRVGFAQQLFNPQHTNGFRSDFLWLFFSTIFIFFAMFAFIPSFKQESKARINVYLCLGWLAAFVIYILKSLFTGMLYFG